MLFEVDIHTFLLWSCWNQQNLLYHYMIFPFIIITTGLYLVFSPNKNPNCQWYWMLNVLMHAHLFRVLHLPLIDFGVILVTYSEVSLLPFTTSLCIDVSYCNSR
ncbi:hypothetical protein BDR07DRAFT_551276 [Suillus spraguei]|nr:hypothetical protein BDR07DRAFT_551276 [Suillus spraguei]